MFFHFGIDAPPFNNGFFRPLIANSGLSVSYFFVLSGFVMILAYGKKCNYFSTAEYLKNRAARILPLYYTALLLAVIYYVIRQNILKIPTEYYPSITDIFLNGLLIQAWIPGKAFTVNNPAWSLSVEAFFYLSFPLIFYAFMKLSRRKFVTAAIAFFVVSQVVFHFLIYKWPHELIYFYFVPLLRLNEFVIGTALGAIFITQIKPLKYSSFAILLLLAAGILVLRKNVYPLDFHNGLFAIFFAPLLFLLAMNQGTLNKIFSKKPLIFLGEISYGIYILQFPVYFFFTSALTYFGHKITPALFYVYLLALLIVSAISHVCIELPLRKRIRKMKVVSQTTTAQ